MALNFQDKKTIILEVKEIAKIAFSAVVANSDGITVDKMNKLRKIGRESDVYIRVVRNTLMRRIVEGTPFECLKSSFVGPNIIAFSNKNPNTAARLFKNFAKDNENFEIKVAAFEGKVIPASQIDRLTNMPTYEEAITNLILIMKEASVGKLIRTLIALQNRNK